MSEGAGPGIVFVVSDGIRGHENQSAGIAWWLSELCGARRETLEIPKIRGWSRFLWYKIRSRTLRKGTVGACRAWLGSVPEGKSLLGEVKRILEESSFRGDRSLFISAGSAAAPWCLALARVLGGACCTIMTPSILGTEPFDFAIVPEHDFPISVPNVLVTLGAPNMIRPDLLKEESRKLSEKFPSSGCERWAILIGGDDANYTLSPSWVRKNIPHLLDQAEISRADVYITTSRRTSPAAEEEIISVVRGKKCVRALILASREDWNPVPGMLGLCGKIFCTEDSVSMISEAATAGCDVRLLPLEHRAGLRSVFQKAVGRLADYGLLSERWIWGIPRFDRMTRRMKEKGLLNLLAEKSPEEKPVRNTAPDLFNEASRSAQWILERYDC